MADRGLIYITTLRHQQWCGLLRHQLDSVRQASVQRLGMKRLSSLADYLVPSLLQRLDACCLRDVVERGGFVGLHQGRPAPVAVRLHEVGGVSQQVPRQAHE